MTSIFISYRRDDSRYQAHRICEAFRRVLPRERLFMDIDSIPPGADFVETLERWVGECEVMLALIGPGWIDAADPDSGRRRLDNVFDFVRIEIREALKRGIPLVPVLLDNAPMPDATKLPDDLKSLVRRQAELVQFRTFDADVARLMRRLRVASADAAGADVPPPSDAEVKPQSASPDGPGGLPQDDREKVRLYKLAAGQGDAYAQNNLGFMYENGRGGLTQDDREAVRLYKLAADQGNADGQRNLRSRNFWKSLFY